MGKRATGLLLLILFAIAIAPWYPPTAQAHSPGIIAWGASGATVSDAQQRLSNWGYYAGPVDGLFGSATYRAVRYFQSTNGLAVDGVIGPATWAALGVATAQGASGGTSPAVSAGQGLNVDLLARVIRAEAEAEPYEGKVAVAAVLLNRVGDSRFPNTMEGVIYEPDAFESVSNGRIYQVPPSSEDTRAARDALNGWDPTYGCVFFWNPAKAVSAWIWSRSIVTQIGSHVFAR